MNVTRFAQLLQVSTVTVYNGLANGRLPTTAKKAENGQWEISEGAFAEWLATAARESPVDESRAPVDLEDLAPSPAAAPAVPNAKSENQAKKIMWEAAHAELDYRKAAGELIEVAVLKKQAFTLARMFRDSMSLIADGCAARCAATSSEVEAHKIISAKTYEVQKGIVNGILDLVQRLGVSGSDSGGLGATTADDGESVGGQEPETSLDQLC